MEAFMEMSEKYRIIYFKDKDEENIDDLFQIIEKENYKLSQFLTENLKKDSSIGIRDDVLKYISENAASFGENQSYLFNIVCFLKNLKMTAEHLAWVNDFFNKNTENHFLIEDFAIVFNEAVERDIPLFKIKEFFSADEDEVNIYERVISYVPDDTDLPRKSAMEPAEELLQKEGKKEYDVSKSDEPGYADIFGNLIMALGIKSDSSESLSKVNENLNKIAAKFQFATSELSVYASEIVHEMETDKKEIERLSALMNLQQRMMASQQNKINELRNEIARLSCKLQDAERTEMKREAINQKICELQNLTLNDRKNTENGYFLTD